MASTSVKNRVAMFEHGGNKSEDDRGPISPMGHHSFKRPGTPSDKSYQKSTTPTGNGLRPATPNGRSFNKPVTPTGKLFNRAAVNESPKGNRASWPWPAEDDVIPAPKQEVALKKDGNRRYSSPYLSHSDKPVILPSPKANAWSNTTKIQSVLDTSPLKHIQNQDAKATSFLRKTPNSPGNVLQKKFDTGSVKPVLPSPSRATSPFSQLSKRDALDENKAPRTNDAASQRMKALQLAKSRNSIGSSTDAKVALNAPYANPEDDFSAESSHSSTTDNELTNIQDEAMPDTDRSVGTEESPSMLSVPGAKHTGRLSRAGKLSQANRRAGTPESAPDLLVSRANGRSQSPMQVVRGTRTVSKVSHQEARKALLQAAQRKKEKADALKEIKEKTESAKIEEQKMANDNASKSQRSAGDAADRLALKAANVLAIKNSSKILFGHSINIKPDDESFRDAEGSVSGSVVSISSEQKRRMNHPAFAARHSPRLSSIGLEKPPSKQDDTPKPFSEELFSSFRHFNELRPEKKDSSAPENAAGKSGYC